MRPPFGATYAAAAVVGVAILVAFFVWHWFFILPIWRVLAEGAVGVAVAAAAVAWAWRTSREAGRFDGPWGGLSFGAVFAGGLVLGELIGLARGPKPDPETAAEILAALPYALVPVLAVALAGAWLARGWRGALAYGLSALVLLLYLAGVAVQRGGVGLGLGLFLLLLPSYLAAGALLPWLERRFAGRVAIGEGHGNNP